MTYLKDILVNQAWIVTFLPRVAIENDGGGGMLGPPQFNFSPPISHILDHSLVDSIVITIHTHQKV